MNYVSRKRGDLNLEWRSLNTKQVFHFSFFYSKNWFSEIPKICKTFFIINSFCMTLEEKENTFTLLSFHFHNQKRKTPKCFLFFLFHFHCFLGQIITWRKFFLLSYFWLLFSYFFTKKNAIEQLKKSDFFYYSA